MRPIKRFCCGCSIATGVQVIGYLNIPQIVILVVMVNISGLYAENATILLPVIDLLIFLRLMNNDSVKLRRRFYLWSLISNIVQDVTWAVYLYFLRTSVVDGECD